MAQQQQWHNKLRQEGLDDMTLLAKVSVPAILDNLYKRFMKDIIYTNIGDVLICMNPFQYFQQLYDDSQIQQYCGKSRLELPPHIYAVAEQAYRSMMVDKDNQCIIISGESGAGKTEAAKKIMHYIAAVSGGGGDIERVKRVILETNPLLESFGNAKTLRNNNSSRFGKYMMIKFNGRGDPDGGAITNYLLEKSRVVSQIPGERSFHVFYQFCKAGAPQELQQYGIQGPQQFNYCMMGQCTDVPGMDDAREYQEMRQAMNVIGISPQEQQSVFTLIAAVLWIGNTTFREQGGHAQVADMSVVDFVASLLGCSAQQLKAAFEVRTMETKRGMKRGTTYKVPLNNVQANASRDALAKAIYDRLFDWLVRRVNQAIHKDGESLIIGVLDIYGFEIFDHNGFEQLSINYVNEKLQQIFIEFTLKNEQEEYEREGIQWTPIPFFNNKVVCDLIESKNPPGVMHVLDDVCRSVHAEAEGADRTFQQRVGTAGGGHHKHFDLRGNRFVIKHYAGDVAYDINGMVERNKDVLFKDLLEVTGVATHPMFPVLFPETHGGVEEQKHPTAGYRIRQQANLLYKTLAACSPHYVRCIKSNENKAPREFDQARIKHQVQYLGLLDNIKVRRAGFAYRATFEKFLTRYMLLSKQTAYAGQRIWQGSALDGCRAILADNRIPQGQFQIGRTKVFLKDPETLFALEDVRERFWFNMAARITNAFRIAKGFKNVASTRIKNAYLTYKYYRVACTTEVQRAYRAYRELAPYHDLRLRGDQLVAGKKERHRLSLTSTRKFFGDYLRIKSQSALVQAMGPHGGERAVFSYACHTLVYPGLFRQPKTSPRFVVLTEQTLCVIMLVQKKNVAEHRLERQVPVAAITSLSLSPFGDHYLIVHADKPEWDVALELNLKTELATHIWQLKNGTLPINFADMVEYRKKKSSKVKLKFVKDEQHAQAFFKKNVIAVASQAPPNSPPARPQMYQETAVPLAVQHLQESVHVITDEDLKRAGKRDRTGGGAIQADMASGGAGAGGGGGGGGFAAAPAAAAPAGYGGGGGGGGGGGRGRGGGRGGGGGRGRGRGALPQPGGGGGGGRGRGRGRGATPAAPAGPKAQAQWDYVGQEQDELSFKAGDVMTIVKKDGEWWQCTLNGRTGFAPANYLSQL